MTAPETRKLMAALGEGRFVGGVVRDALLGLQYRHIDIAVPMPPEETLKRLETAGIMAVPTGFEHGTVTAILNGLPFEITSLRRDVETDGRHAIVAFTDDWEEDSSRRDFTMNALYAAPDGEIFDYHGGIQDLIAGRVRFVGEAPARIREDYLRVLRLFRFHAWYGKGDMDAEALRAAAGAKQVWAIVGRAHRQGIAASAGVFQSGTRAAHDGGVGNFVRTSALCAGLPRLEHLVANRGGKPIPAGCLAQAGGDFAG